ncbi:MAG: amidohydrolase [Clostridia bacterium]|nr:amidohydrolase [Clostridia bacterium]
MLSRAKTIQEELIHNRRYLHRNAETGFRLHKTKTFITDELQSMGLSPYEVGGSVAAVLDFGGSTNTLLLRADVDALPMQEKSELSFACKTGNVHACGHDMHAAMLLGAARLLTEQKDKLCGRVKFLFQAAEESLEGAKAALDSGALKDVRAAMTLHVMTDSPYSTGTVVVADGVSAPAADFFEVKIKGKACHGSAPQNGVDAISAAAHVLLGLHELSARELSVSNPAVLTVGQITGGHSANVIAEETVFKGTLRAFDESVRENVKKRLQAISSSIAKAFRAKAKTAFVSGCPTLVNDRALSELAYLAAKAVSGKENVFRSSALTGSETAQKSGGSEDFAYISHAVPSVMLALAAGERKKGYDLPLHHAGVRFDEDALCYGAAVYAQVAVEYLKGESHGKGK